MHTHCGKTKTFPRGKFGGRLVDVKNAELIQRRPTKLSCLLLVCLFLAAGVGCSKKEAPPPPPPPEVQVAEVIQKDVPIYIELDINWHVLLNNFGDLNFGWRRRRGSFLLRAANASGEEQAHKQQTRKFRWSPLNQFSILNIHKSSSKFATRKCFGFSAVCMQLHSKP